MSSTLPYMPVIGAICTARRANGRWRVTQYANDGIVRKVVLKSVETGLTIQRFTHEITEVGSSAYDNVDEFLNENLIEMTSDCDLMEQLFDDESFAEETVPVAEMPSGRFKAASAHSIDVLKKANTEKSTDRKTKWAIKILKEWMQESEYCSTEFELLEPSTLDGLLQLFYSAVRTKDGQEYSKPSLIGIRASINRYLTSPPFSRNMNLMRDREFVGSNQVLTGLVKTLKREGKDTSTHKEPICDEDLEKLYKSGLFDESRPKTLQNKVMYEIISQFGRRGQEGLRSLTRDSFTTDVDPKGRNFIRMAYNEADKTHKGLNAKETEKNPGMYEHGGIFCPYHSYLKYVSKLNPNLPDLWQRPLRNVKEDDETWYANKPIGVNLLSSFMSRMSEEADLSQRYTNHCIRARVCSTLKEQGYSSRAIMSVTGHRNEASLSSYIKPSADERASLSRALCPRSPSATAVQLQATPPSQSSMDMDSDSTQNSTIHTSSVQSSSALHMFTGNISHSTITMNVYHKSS